MTTAAASGRAEDARRLHRAALLGASTIHEASGGLGALPTGIRPITSGLTLAGRAVTVSGPAGDNLWLHRGLAMAGPGDVLVASVGGHHEAGYWGELLSWGARSRGLAGVVVDGCVRDSDRLTAIGVPVFARGLCVRGTTKLPDGDGAINGPISIGGVTIAAGDLVVGDGDGVVAIPADRIDEVLRLGTERMEREAQVVFALQQSGSTISLLGLPAQSVAEPSKSDGMVPLHEIR
ncbi:RraA family protein [Rugosimonospora acidiphila]|uniref:Putative 4-hydroxy-4-methyl-2-oxoglutarate aldolase n=1 Tax=Rugosimonospora acidiphila TaxID=556531 RepID=A0ABP9SVB8_9ACTN